MTPLGNGIWTIKWSRDRWRQVTLEGQSRDPNTLRAQYLENGWIRYYEFSTGIDPNGELKYRSGLAIHDWPNDRAINNRRTSSVDDANRFSFVYRTILLLGAISGRFLHSSGFRRVMENWKKSGNLIGQSGKTEILMYRLCWYSARRFSARWR